MVLCAACRPLPDRWARRHRAHLGRAVLLHEPEGGANAGDAALGRTAQLRLRGQRGLRQRGAAVHPYQGRVSHLYRQILQDEGIQRDEAFKVQDANRRARDQARHEMLTGAPEDLVQEVERPVALGARGKDEL